MRQAGGQGLENGEEGRREREERGSWVVGMLAPSLLLLLSPQNSSHTNPRPLHILLQHHLYVLCLPPQLLPPSAAPTPMRWASHFPPAACSQTAPLLKGRNHSFSLGFISLAIKCKGGSKIQHLLSAGDCMVQRSSVWVLEPDLWIRTLALPFKLYILGEVKKASVKISFCIH